MKVMAINSSPRSSGQSKTAMMLDALVAGMKQAGADVEMVELRKKKINPCAGCFTCWSKTPGVCIHQDDMSKELYSKYIASDIAVLASPLYHFTVNAVMKMFIERTLPAIEPYMYYQDGKSHHPLRGRHPMLVFLSVAGFPEQRVFDQLHQWVNFVYEPAILAEIYRGGAESLAQPLFKDVWDEILNATQTAGEELVKTFKISPETNAVIHQEFPMDFNDVAELANSFWNTCIEEGVTPKEFHEKDLKPRPRNIKEFLVMLKVGFKPDQADGVEAVCQFDFSGEPAGECYFSIKDGSITTSEGKAAQTDVTIKSPFDIWMDILDGRAEGAEMLAQAGGTQRY
jgi:FMN-dependent NADH-azoreductase